MDIYLKSGNIIYLILIAILSGIVAYFYYKKSDLQSPKKIIFPVIRFFSLFFILLLFLTPILSFIKSSLPESKNIILIDASKSLEIENRFNDELKILNQKTPAGNSNYLFGNGLIKEIKQGDFYSIKNQIANSGTTNLFKTLSGLSSIQNINSVSILSDGNVNEGGNPSELARSFDVPFSYILIGDTSQKKDVLIKNVYVNEYAYIDSKVPVKIEAESFKTNEQIKLNLFEEDNLIESKTLSVNDKISSYTVDFNLLSGTEGIKKYKIEAEPIKDEITLKNNSEYFFVNYLSNKFKILVYSGGPSADFGYLKEQLSTINNFQITYQTQKNANDFYEPKAVNYNEYDAIIFSGFPTAQTNSVLLNELKTSIDKFKTSLVYIESRNVDYSKLTMFQDNLPFTISGSSNNELETSLKLISGSEFTKSNDLNSFNSSPQVFTNSSSYNIKPQAETILINSKNSQPAFVISNSADKNSAAMLFHGFYKLRLNKQNDLSPVFNKLLSSSIIAISSQDKKKIMDFTLSSSIAGVNDEVILKARLKNAEELSSPQVKVKITSNSFIKDIELNKISSDYFEGTFRNDSKGDYKITADLFSNSSLIEAANQRLLIDENNLEFKKTNSDRTILAELSSLTNGRNLTNLTKSEISSYLDSLNTAKNDIVKAQSDFNLKFNPYFLSLVIFFLCLEWFLRKRNNLS